MLDRDGVMTHLFFHPEGGFDVPYSLNQVQLVDGITDVIAWANHKDIPVFVLSNQPAHALGKMTLEMLLAIDKQMIALLKERGAYIQQIYRCLHHPDAVLPEMRILCTCRKPEPGLFFAVRDEHGIDLQKSVFVGDKVTDMQAGEKAGCHTILYLHQNDLPHKVAAAHAYKAVHTASNHTETLALVSTLFNSEPI